MYLQQNNSKHGYHCARSQALRDIHRIWWPPILSWVIGYHRQNQERSKKRQNYQVPAKRPAFSPTTAEALVVRNHLLHSKRNKFVPGNDPHIKLKFFIFSHCGGMTLPDCLRIFLISYLKEFALLVHPGQGSASLTCPFWRTACWSTAALPGPSLTAPPNAGALLHTLIHLQFKMDLNKNELAELHH